MARGPELRRQQRRSQHKHCRQGPRLADGAGVAAAHGDPTRVSQVHKRGSTTRGGGGLASAQAEPRAKRKGPSQARKVSGNASGDQAAAAQVACGFPLLFCSVILPKCTCAAGGHANPTCPPPRPAPGTTRRRSLRFFSPFIFVCSLDLSLSLSLVLPFPLSLSLSLSFSVKVSFVNGINQTNHSIN